MMAIEPLFRALADETRIKIAALLIDRALSAQEIASAIDLAPAVVMRHLGRLCDAGLVEVAPQRGQTVYHFCQQPLLDALRASAARPAAPDFSDDVAAYDQKVLGDFLVDGRLKAIPVQLKKRDAVLRFLVQQFEPGQTYSEKEVSLVLAAYHEDFATLRRALVDARLLDRKNGQYWRVA